MENIAVLRGNVENILEERERVRVGLLNLSFVVRVCESDANFLLFEIDGKAQEMYKYMAGKKGHCKTRTQ